MGYQYELKFEMTSRKTTGKDLLSILLYIQKSINQKSDPTYSVYNGDPGPVTQSDNKV